MRERILCLTSAAVSWLQALRTLILVLPAYRPEKYYMRGPGPKWRDKHHGSTR